MIIPPYYETDSDLLKLISQIDANRIVIAGMKAKKPIIDKIQRVSYLKSSLYSARIEGNLHTFEELDERAKTQREIFNILRGIQHVNVHITERSRISRTVLLKLHAEVLKGISAEAGEFRHEPSAIFNQAGIAVYVTPPPHKIREMIEQLSAYANNKHEVFPLINAFISHLCFEKVHPFLDGNGRVGRLLIYAILRSKGYNFGLHIPFEEYLDDHKDLYYYHLENGLKQTHHYLAFMLNAFYEQTENVKSLLMAEMNKQDEVYLPPRQEELYELIKEHKMMSFDSLKRRFLKIPERTLRYDLKKLCDSKLVVKVGETRGAVYRLNKN